MKSQCLTCKWKNELTLSNSKEKNLWNFPFLLYPDYNQMKQKLEEWYGENDTKSFWNTYNEDGYTFSQWNIYYLSKKYHRYRPIQESVITLFEVLSTFPFFNDLLLLGTREDSKHHTVHHYLYNMEFGVNAKQKKMFYVLKDSLKNKAFLQRDSRGYNVYDYYKKLNMPYDLQKECQRLTESYKKQENELFAHLSFLKKCTDCGAYLQPYNDMVENYVLFYDFLDKNEEWSESIEDFVTKREKCNQIYKDFLNMNDNDSIERHDYVVETYRKLFIW